MITCGCLKIPFYFMYDKILPYTIFNKHYFNECKNRNTYIIILGILTAFLTKLTKQVYNTVTIIFNSNMENISIQIFYIRIKNHSSKLRIKYMCTLSAQEFEKEHW